MRKLCYIAGFAVLGGGLREWLSLLVSWPQHFWLTVIINVSGTLLLSFVTTLLPARLPVSEDIIAGMSVGLVGSFTTFSTFTYETIQLWQQGQTGLVFAYVGASLGLGLLAGLTGNLLSDHWLPRGNA